MDFGNPEQLSGAPVVRQILARVIQPYELYTTC
jgi:hypothetical protein